MIGQIELEGQNQAWPDRSLWKRLKHCIHIPTSAQNFKIIFGQQMSIIKTLKVSNSLHWTVTSRGAKAGCRNVVPASPLLTGSSLDDKKAEQWSLAFKVLDQSPISGARGQDTWTSYLLSLSSLDRSLVSEGSGTKRRDILPALPKSSLSCELVSGGAWCTRSSIDANIGWSNVKPIVRCASPPKIGRAMRQ